MSPISPRRSPVSLFAFLLLASVAFAATGCFTPGWYPGGYGRGYGSGYGGGGGCAYGCGGYDNGYYNRRPYYNNNRYDQYGHGGKGHRDYDDDDDDDRHRGRKPEPYRGPSNGPSNGPPGPTQAYQGPSNGPPGSTRPTRVSNEERARDAKNTAAQRNKANGQRQSRSGDSEWRDQDGSRD